VTAREVTEAVVSAGLMPLHSDAAELFAGYVDLLVRWNARLNLTAVREPNQIIRRHLVECILCAQELPDVKTLLDFGSGAGLPGIPIAILRPEIEVTLGESQGKKAAFLREAVRTLGLNAQIYDRRIENMAPESFFDAVTLRAVDRMQEAAKVALERVLPRGWLVIFATAGTEHSLRSGLSDLIWAAGIPTPGLETGILLFAQRPGST